MKTVPTDVEENMAKKLTPSPIGDHGKSYRKCYGMQHVLAIENISNEEDHKKEE